MLKMLCVLLMVAVMTASSYGTEPPCPKRSERAVTASDNGPQFFVVPRQRVVQQRVIVQPRVIQPSLVGPPVVYRVAPSTRVLVETRRGFTRIETRRRGRRDRERTREFRRNENAGITGDEATTTVNRAGRPTNVSGQPLRNLFRRFRRQ